MAGICGSAAFRRWVRYIVVVFILPFLLYSCGGGSSGLSFTKAKWTIMVYMDGDNNLNDATYYDLEELESVGSSRDVNIVVEDDTLSGPTKRYFVKKGKLVELDNLGELNMADYRTLADFGIWASRSYPAEHYLLILWDHGLGFENFRPLSSRDILWDNHYDNVTVANGTNSMSIPSVEKALARIKDAIGRKIDIVGMDACLMNMVEVAYQIKDSANYLVAPENTDPFYGWPYDAILYNLESNVFWSAKQFAENIVADFINSYAASYDPTMSAIDLSKIVDVVSSFSNLTDSLLSEMLLDPNIEVSLQTTIFNNVQRFDENGDGIINTQDSYADLYDLSRLIYDNDNMTKSIKDNANLVMSEVEAAVVANAHKGSVVSNAHGLSIWFPTPSDFDYYERYYSQLNFAENTKWEKLLGILE